jgi:hypothetical protein
MPATTGSKPTYVCTNSSSITSGPHEKVEGSDAQQEPWVSVTLN